MSGDTAFHSAAVRPDSFDEASSLSVMSPSRAARLEPVVSTSACRLAIRASMSSSDRLMLRQRITVRNSLGGLPVVSHGGFRAYETTIPVVQCTEKPRGALLLTPGIVAVHRPVETLVDDRQGCIARPPPRPPGRPGGAPPGPGPHPSGGLPGVPPPAA